MKGGGRLTRKAKIEFHCYLFKINLAKIFVCGIFQQITFSTRKQEEGEQIGKQRNRNRLNSHDTVAGENNWNAEKQE